MAMCKQCGRAFKYDDEVGYDPNICSPFCDGVLSQQAKIAALEAEIERLTAESSYLCAVEWRDKYLAAQAIVDQLPLTADGVPVVPGMVLYREPGGYEFTLGEPTWDDLLGSWPSEYLRGASPEECYSTREAAEAAGESADSP